MKEKEDQATPEEAHDVDEEIIDDTPEDASSSDEPADDSPPDTPPEDEDPADEVSPQQVSKPSGKSTAVAWFALLLSLAALSGVGYLYYTLIYQDPLTDLQSALLQNQSARSNEIDSLRGDLARQREEVTAMLAETRQRQSAELAETQAGVLESLQQTLLAAPPSQREWKLAEAEYLLRIGNHRVLMEQDTQGALTVFLAVDQILAELDDFALHQVRAILADEIIALRQVPRQDIQGLYLRLEALKSQLGSLILKTPEYIADEPESDESQTIWNELSAQLKEFVRVRRVGGNETVGPLLAPSEEHYLELNLRLALEQAQLAALKRQQAVYEQALSNVREWLLQYADERSHVLIEEIDELLKLELEQPLPGVSGSLSELHKVRRGGE